jgi:hypothetical protein
MELRDTHITKKEPPMTTNDNSQSPAVARTDDLLATSADAKGGARGFEAQSTPETLQTGMEGIADATSAQKSNSTDSQASGITQTVQDKPGQVRDRKD